MKWHPINSNCLKYNAANIAYEEITCTYPWLRKYYLSMETKFDPVYIRDWMVGHPVVPIVAVSLYVIGIIYGRFFYFTTKRAAWNWRTSLAAWNFGLSLFSFIGLVRVLPTQLHNLTHYTWKENFCMDPESQFGSGSTGLWILLFILSKIPELFDTYFIVIHKKPLIFLHWYHHISVLLYCWQSYVTKSPVGIIFCCMNYAVHSFMYFYYFLMAIHMKPKFINAVYITIAQISQMIVGVLVTIISCYLLWFDKEVYQLENDNTKESCHLKKENIIAALIMYGSYLALFLEFFLQRYFSKSTSSNKSKKVIDGSKGTTTSQNGKFNANTNGYKAHVRKED